MGRTGPRRNAGNFFILLSSFQPLASQHALNSRNQVAKSELPSNFPGNTFDMFCATIVTISHRCHQICYTQNMHTRPTLSELTFISFSLILYMLSLQGAVISYLYILYLIYQSQALSLSTKPMQASCLSHFL